MSEKTDEEKVEIINEKLKRSIFESIVGSPLGDKSKYREPDIKPGKQDYKNTAKEAQLSYKSDIKKDREKTMTDALKMVSKVWTDGLITNQELKKKFAYVILVFLGFQIGCLLLISYKISITNVELKNIGAYSLYITGVFGQMFYLPKTIAKHLFPEAEQNHLLELIKLLKEKQ